MLRIIDTDLCRGSYSASLDEAIARGVSRGLEPTLHFYRRSPPAVTLGYFCKVEEDVDTEYCMREGVSLVRRWTGGGTIYTDENVLVYGLSCPKEYLPENIGESYEIICGAIVDCLFYFGIKAEYKPINDVLVGRRKISGSAQFRRWSIVLQHGTILMNADFDKMFGAIKPKMDKLRKRGFSDARDAMTSIYHERGLMPEVGVLKDKFTESLCRRIGNFCGYEVIAKRGEITKEEKEEAEILEKEKYGREEWTYLR